MTTIFHYMTTIFHYMNAIFHYVTTIFHYVTTIFLYVNAIFLEKMAVTSRKIPIQWELTAFTTAISSLVRWEIWSTSGSIRLSIEEISLWARLIALLVAARGSSACAADIASTRVIMRERRGQIKPTALLHSTASLPLRFLFGCPLTDI